MSIRSKGSLRGGMNVGIGPKGDTGESGATFTPILDEEGNLSWSNDKGLPNPEPVNIRGPKGDSGGGVSSWNDLTDKPDMITPPATASVGQTIVVKSVDEDGKPTEWEVADIPSGGGDKWELIADITLQEQVSSFSIDQDMNGETFLLRKYWLVYAWAQVTDGSEIPTAGYLVENGRQFGDGRPPLYTSAFESASASGKRGGYIVAELLPNNVLWEQNYRNSADSSVALEPFSPVNSPATNILKYTVMKQRDAYEPFYQIGGNSLSIPVGSRIMLWGVRV